jgi:hypothetical protein
VEISRREALTALGSIGLGVLVVACSDDGSGASVATTTTDPLTSGRTTPVSVTPGRPLVRRLDHVYTVVEDPGKALRFLHDVLQLPVAWPFADYGSFASGGIGLGNLNLEIVKAGGAFAAHHPAVITGMGFEPATAIDDAFINELDRRGIAHSPPTPGASWTNVNLTGVTDTEDDTLVFATEYHYPGAKDAALRRKPLDQVRGGRLRVAGAREVTIGVTDLGVANRRWQALLAPATPDRDNRWRLGRGPTLRLVHHGDNAVLGLSLTTTSTNSNRLLASLRNHNDPLVGLALSCQPA